MFAGFVHIENCLLLIRKHQARRPCWTAMVCSMMDCFESPPKKHWVWDSSDQMDVSPAVTPMMSWTPFMGVHLCIGFGWDRAELCCSSVRCILCIHLKMYTGMWDDFHVGNSSPRTTALQEDTILTQEESWKHINRARQIFPAFFFFSAENIKQMFPILVLVCECYLTPLLKWSC